MAVDAAQMQAEFPEFADIPVDDITAKIADAVLFVNTTTWGEFTDLGVKYMAAHLLAISPFGEIAKLDAKDGSTVYLRTFNMKKVAVASGCRVI